MNEMLSRSGPAFSSGTDGERWEANWCARCTVDADFRRGKTDIGCPLLVTALVGEIPGEWLEQPPERYPDDAYHCVNFRGPGHEDPEPKPQPEPPDMDGLFERPERRVRMLVQPVGVFAGVSGGSDAH